MAKHICPACGHSWSPLAKVKKGIDEIEYIRANGKAKRRPFYMLSIMRARAAGTLKSGPDWLPAYLISARAWQDHWGKMAARRMNYATYDQGQEYNVQRLINEAENELHNASGEDIL